MKTLEQFIERHSWLEECKYTFDRKEKKLKKSVCKRGLEVLKEIYDYTDKKTLCIAPNYVGDINIEWEDKTQDILFTIFSDKIVRYIIHENHEDRGGEYDINKFKKDLGKI